MEYFSVTFFTFFVSILTLFSGFGLGTLLMPAFAIFFPIEIAIALTAFIHLANNVFKLGLFIKFIEGHVLLHFGLPALIGSFIGAHVLLDLAHLKPFFHYSLFKHIHDVTPAKLVIAALLMIFVVLELFPHFREFSLHKRWLSLGGAVSGFFGGISGNQGALRSAFLIKSGLTKEEFIGTGVAIACLVDISRIFVYSREFKSVQWSHHTTILTLGTISALLGTFIGNRLLKKVTFQEVQFVVACVLFGIALGLATGFI